MSRQPRSRKAKIRRRRDSIAPSKIPRARPCWGDPDPRRRRPAPLRRAPPATCGSWRACGCCCPKQRAARLWPTSFAFSSDLDFDVLILPRVDRDAQRSKDQAADYPDGTYELALQRAAEAGNQDDLNVVFSRRDSRQTIKLALVLLAVLSMLVIFLHGPCRRRTARSSIPCRFAGEEAAAAAGIIAVGDPITSASMLGLCQVDLGKGRAAA